jgi:phenylalanyl-tRNA synthetase beta chain
MSGDIGKVKPIPRYPAITRDLSVIVDEPVTWAQISSCVQSKAPAVLEETQFVNIYRGKPIAKGKKSITVSLRFRDDDGTLQHDTVDGFESDIVAELKNKLGVELRTA